MKLEDVQELIGSEAELRMLVHQRRIALLKTKKYETHRDFLCLLEKIMTKEQIIIHLFAEQSNATMSKAAIEILSSGSPSVATVRVKVAEIESSLSYEGGRGIWESKVYRSSSVNTVGVLTTMKTNVGARVLLAVPEDTLQNSVEGENLHLGMDQLPLLLLHQLRGQNL